MSPCSPVTECPPSPLVGHSTSPQMITSGKAGRRRFSTGKVQVVSIYFIVLLLSDLILTFENIWFFDTVSF